MCTEWVRFWNRKMIRWRPQKGIILHYTVMEVKLSRMFLTLWNRRCGEEKVHTGVDDRYRYIIFIIQWKKSKRQLYSRSYTKSLKSIQIGSELGMAFSLLSSYRRSKTDSYRDALPSKVIKQTTTRLLGQIRPSTFRTKCNNIIVLNERPIHVLQWPAWCR